MTVKNAASTGRMTRWAMLRCARSCGMVTPSRVVGRVRLMALIGLGAWPIRRRRPIRASSVPGMKIRVTLSMDVEVDEIELKAAAVKAISGGGGVRTADGSPAEFGAELAFVGDPA